MTGWSDLRDELDRWAAAGRVATFWWRDDDAVSPTPALDRLLGLARAHAAPVALAVIPARAEPALARRLAAEPLATAVQHGYAHANHAPPGRPKAELGPHRPVGVMLGELARGALDLDRLFGGAWTKTLVPPHNRIAAALAEALDRAGYVGLSTYGPRPARRAGAGCVLVNTHVDIMEWTATRAFLGEGAALDLALAHLRARREGRVDADEPTGLLTHHLAHDEGAWRFTEQVLQAVGTHRAARWAPPREAFAP